MIIDLWNWFHSIGFHFYTIPAIAAALIALVAGLVHWRNERKRDRDHEDRLEEIYEEVFGQAEEGGRS